MPVTTTTGEDAGLEEAAVEEFGASLRGQVLLAGDDGYDDARRLWNARSTRGPR